MTEVLTIKMQCVEATKNKMGAKILFGINPVISSEGNQTAEQAASFLVLDKIVVNRLEVGKEYTITITE